MSYKILAINPGSTSTKLAVYEDETVLFEETLRHSAEELAPFDSIMEQSAYRRTMIDRAFQDRQMSMDTLDAVVGRGGLLRPLRSGTYAINEAMLEDLRQAVNGQHASNLGAVLAHELGEQLHIPAYIVDPVVVDELHDLARLSGLPGYERTSIFHALNQKAVARKLAKEKGVALDELNLIVCHMGGGISVGAHEKGSVVDVNNALLGEGPYSPERAGGLPVHAMIALCEQFSSAEVKKKIAGKGGLVAYLQTNDGREVQRRIQEGDTYAKLVYEGMAYQIAKEIGACATVLKGTVDAIILTGGLAYDPFLVESITQRVSFIAPLAVFPGEDEMIALVQGALRVLKKEEDAQNYPN